jgi:ribonuclease HII
VRRPTLSREAAVWAEGRLLIGVDEAGRGPLAGPVVAAAVVFPAGARRLTGLRDSKTLAPARREALALDIRRTAFALSVGAASVAEIDRLNIRVATALAMRRAVLRLLPNFPTSQPPRLLIDGLPMPEIGFLHQALIEGDSHCQSVSAAGIIAKTVRDRLMRRLALRHPGYAWDANKGYGSEGHLLALAEHGPTPHHRRSFSPVNQLHIL